MEERAGMGLVWVLTGSGRLGPGRLVFGLVWAGSQHPGIILS